MVQLFYMKNILISTYPRTGQHLLKGLLSQQIENEIKTTHFAKKIKNFYTITMVRDPLDTISSRITMNASCKNEGNKIYNSIENSSKYAMLKFINFYEDIQKYADLYINYEKLLNNPVKNLDKLYSYLTINKKTNELNTPIFKNDENNGYIVSSKNELIYEEIRLHISKSELINSCYKIYDKINLLCI